MQFKIIITDGAFEQHFKKFDPTRFSSNTNYDISTVIAVSKTIGIYQTN